VTLNLSSEYVYPQTPAKDENFNRTGGLTKREHFAGLAMQGMLNLITMPQNNVALSKVPVCTTAVEIADRLMEELEKPKA
jgi:hypothetical protein